ncbi:helix-turn-helix domain-containing protein [Intestinibacillus sp. Marseille-P6563]|uniref:helix-turn-helix domain-containing protein n=1 Tax=Intestinibacillus sp. Marseille-P6563 TaxID=2364792 RepID=UPI000F047F25|nr:helix-turn-helix transcriptional regulator [Intestinibacillus sp. Marseille-P6563]
MYRYRLKEIREDRDLKQREIANVLHVAQNTYCNYENGVHEIPLHVLIRLSRYYEVNLEYLLGLTDDPTPLPPSVRPDI